jgi:hypothetical protein
MADGRKKNGGRRPNSGRKSKAEEEGLAHLLNKCWPLEAREACVRALAIAAADPTAETHIESIKILMPYTYGKPKEKVEHSGEDGNAIVLKVIYEQPRTRNKSA